MPKVKLSIIASLFITVEVGWLVLAACGDTTPTGRPTSVVFSPVALPPATPVASPSIPTQVVPTSTPPLPTRPVQSVTTLAPTTAVTRPPAPTNTPIPLPTATPSMIGCPGGASGAGSAALTNIQKIDAYICKLSFSQQIGELLM